MFYSHKLSYNKMVLLALWIIFCFSAFDGAFTLWGLNLNAIEEVNPIMNSLIAYCPDVFMVYKLALPIILSVITWHMRNKVRWLIICGLTIVLCIYTVIIVFHICWILQNRPLSI